MTSMKYFDEYSARVDSKEIPASKPLILAIERIKNYKEKYEFVQSEADRRIRFIEENCANTKGSNDLLKLALPQKVWLEVAWGFYTNREVTVMDPVTLQERKEVRRQRLIHEIPLIVSRASGKSTLVAAVGLVGQMIDGEYGADVMLLAYDVDQAKILFNTAKAMTDKEGTVFESLKKDKLYGSTKIGLVFHPTNSVIKSKASDPKRLDGLNNHMNVYDECVNGENEVLTSCGWTKISEIMVTDWVVQWDNGGLSFVSPSRVNKTWFDEGFEVDYGHGDTIVQSSGHRNLVRSKYDGTLKDKYPGELSNSYYYVAEGKAEDLGEGLDDWERLFIMTQADGSVVSSKQTVAHVAVKKDHKKKEIERLASVLPLANFKEVKIGREGFRRWTYNIPKDVFRTKLFSEVFNFDEFDYKKAHEFIDYVLLWDAWIDKKYDDKYYCSTEKQNIDFVQAVATLAGYTTVIFHSIDRRKKTYKDYYRLKLTSSKNRIAKAKPTKVNDYLYCMTVPSGYFLMRTPKGRTIITGNCHTYETDFIKITNDGSSKKRQNWQSWYISTNGHVRDAVFDKYMKKWMEYLENDTHHEVMPFLYQLDSADEVHDETMWRKAVPMLGVTTTKETIRSEIERASGDMVAQNEILTKTFNLPVNNYAAFFTNQECQGNRELFDFGVFHGTKERKARVTVGMDLSDVEDIASVTFMTIVDGIYYFMSRKYIPRLRVEKMGLDIQQKYEQWESEGHLVMHEFDYNDRDYIWDDIFTFMRDNLMLPVKFGLDPWHAPEIEKKIAGYYGKSHVGFVKQITKVLSPAMKKYKALISANKIVFDDPVATWCHGNVNVKIDANGNIFPNRAKSKAKIDVFASHLDAFLIYDQEKDNLSHYMK